MNTQERDQLGRFLQQLSEVKLTAKDPEADTMIAEVVSRQPDAAYLLVQRAMLLDQALNVAKVQISDLQSQLQAVRSPSQNGFLNNDPWAQPVNQSAQVPGAGSYQMPRAAPQPAMQVQAQPQPQSSGFLGGGSSFLGNVATTAAGVVAGSFLFQGIGNLLGHHAASSWGQSGNFPADHVTEEFTTINNYYGDEAAPEQLHTAAYDEFPTDEDMDSFENDGESDWM